MMSNNCLNQPLMDSKQVITLCRNQPAIHMFLDSTDARSVNETGFLTINNPWYSKHLDKIIQNL